MVGQGWLLPRLSELFAGSGDRGTGDDRRIQAQWQAAIATLAGYCHDPQWCERWGISRALLLASPAPFMAVPQGIAPWQTILFHSEDRPEGWLRTFLPTPGERAATVATVEKIPLIPPDPLNTEQFGLLLTPRFALLILLGWNDQGDRAFHFSFDPDLIGQALMALQGRSQLTQWWHTTALDAQIAAFPLVAPDYRLVTDITQGFSHHLAQQISPSRRRKMVRGKRVKAASKPVPNRPGEDVELLQALAHEIRTPLTTIRTLTKLLLKKKRQFAADVIQRLEAIEQECNEQISRMELIFRAIELETAPSAPPAMHLVPMSLEQLFQSSIPRWQKQAERRHVVLDFLLPVQMPQVVSDPAILDQVLTGLLENFTRNLPTGGQLQVQVTTVGDRLKLELQSPSSFHTHWFKTVGQVLMFQPETGSLGLNMDVTKNLFAALGGKFTVRQRSDHGDVLTIFLPLGH